MTSAERNYVDLLTRWLTVKRDWPGLEGDEPMKEQVEFYGRFASYCGALRAQTIRDFERTI